MVLYTQAQPVEFFQQYQNDTLVANDILPKEKEVTNFVRKSRSI